jgi:hypothetical protein
VLEGVPPQAMRGHPGFCAAAGRVGFPAWCGWWPIRWWRRGSGGGCGWSG